MANSLSFAAGVAPGIDGMFDWPSFIAGVAPGIDDNAVPVVLRVDNEGSSGSLGKLSVYNTLALLLFSAPGIDDNAAPDVLRVGAEGSSGSLGKLSVYNTLVLLLFSTPFSFQQSCASISVPPNNMTSS